MTHPASDIAFTPAVKAIQAKRGSRENYAKVEERGGWRTTVTPDLAGFLGEARSFYLATASADGQPYAQHRGGPPGFLRVLDEKTLGFADFKGNRQYITTGNLAENPKAYIFVMDYAQRRRVKLWGRARVVEDDPALLARLWPEGYKARDEQVILFEVEAWDTNCPQHIPQMFHAKDVGRTITQFQARIKELEAEVAALKGGRDDKEPVHLPALSLSKGADGAGPSGSLVVRQAHHEAPLKPPRSRRTRNRPAR